MPRTASTESARRLGERRGSSPTHLCAAVTDRGEGFWPIIWRSLLGLIRLAGGLESLRGCLTRLSGSPLGP
jgi:hypothetical protein